MIGWRNVVGFVPVTECNGNFFDKYEIRRTNTVKKLHYSTPIGPTKTQTPRILNVPSPNGGQHTGKRPVHVHPMYQRDRCPASTRTLEELWQEQGKFTPSTYNASRMTVQEWCRICIESHLCAFDFTLANLTLELKVMVVEETNQGQSPFFAGRLPETCRGYLETKPWSSPIALSKIFTYSNKWNLLFPRRPKC